MNQHTTETPDTSQPLAASDDSSEAAGNSPYELRQPAVEDAPGIHRLISLCPPLDLNSLYAYLLLCLHYSGTCVVAASADRIDGFVSAYLPPGRPDTLFVWQVAVADHRRGQGLGSRMLQSLLNRPGLQGVRYIEATVGPGNQASRAMFAAWARSLNVGLHEAPLFDASLFDAGHEEECLLRLGPRSL